MQFDGTANNFFDPNPFNNVTAPVFPTSESQTPLRAWSEADANAVPGLSPQSQLPMSETSMSLPAPHHMHSSYLPNFEPTQAVLPAQTAYYPGCYSQSYADLEAFDISQSNSHMPHRIGVISSPTPRPPPSAPSTKDGPECGVPPIVNPASSSLHFALGDPHMSTTISTMPSSAHTIVPVSDTPEPTTIQPPTVETIRSLARIHSPKRKWSLELMEAVGPAPSIFPISTGGPDADVEGQQVRKKRRLEGNIEAQCQQKMELLVTTLGFRPTDITEILPHDQNFHYVKSLERYIDYLQEQMRLAKIYLPIMSRDLSSCNTGLTKTSQRTLLVHMLQDVRTLYDKVLDEEYKFQRLSEETILLEQENLDNNRGHSIAFI